ncbi:uncharacterized protein MONOS_13317 [Monocercomonoides exilis]|uniref:uncharacterized protein n=1 Tax=Monocercomonoides exilis TaxID=2049356 RepID=UPI003559AC2A|nr:hypothetical protein MONOS_13317 [Monocercomonoides exilis]|eukprot:MONOS_13317.1-p1 / transcript=MONOS_13317.1 / gene=MONOS_13317 / organism=Monocercomonoides_exilis_PA203 / gene_product=unspecified product / transcript_product=unspecified product / location=Mono_scaffold00808:943-5536(-) / protein_length=1150 / sequence_SO=supercontig / SO=protein_coding / is_pseudo=false
MSSKKTYIILSKGVEKKVLVNGASTKKLFSDAKENYLKNADTGDEHFYYEGRFWPEDPNSVNRYVLVSLVKNPALFQEHLEAAIKKGKELEAAASSLAQETSDPAPPMPSDVIEPPEPSPLASSSSFSSESEIPQTEEQTNSSNQIMQEDQSKDLEVSKDKEPESKQEPSNADNQSVFPSDDLQANEPPAPYPESSIEPSASPAQSPKPELSQPPEMSAEPLMEPPPTVDTALSDPPAPLPQEEQAPPSDLPEPPLPDVLEAPPVTPSLQTPALPAPPTEPPPPSDQMISPPLPPDLGEPGLPPQDDLPQPAEMLPQSPHRSITPPPEEIGISSTEWDLSEENEEAMTAQKEIRSYYLGGYVDLRPLVGLTKMNTHEKERRKRRKSLKKPKTEQTAADVSDSESSSSDSLSDEAFKAVKEVSPAALSILSGMPSISPSQRSSKPLSLSTTYSRVLLAREKAFSRQIPYSSETLFRDKMSRESDDDNRSNSEEENEEEEKIIEPEILVEKLDINEIPLLLQRIQEGSEDERVPCVQKLGLLVLRKQESVPLMLNYGVLTMISDLMKDPIPEDLYIACSDLLNMIQLRTAPFSHETSAMFYIDPLLTISEESDPDLYMTFIPAFATILSSGPSQQLALLSSTFADRLPTIISSFSPSSSERFGFGLFQSGGDGLHKKEEITPIRVLGSLLVGISSFLSSAVTSTSLSASTSSSSSSSSSTSSSSSSSTLTAPSSSMSTTTQSQSPITKESIDSCLDRLLPLIPILPPFAESDDEVVAQNALWILKQLNKRQRELNKLNKKQLPTEDEVENEIAQTVQAERESVSFVPFSSAGSRSSAAFSLIPSPPKTGLRRQGSLAGFSLLAGSRSGHSSLAELTWTDRGTSIVAGGGGVKRSGSSVASGSLVSHSSGRRGKGVFGTLLSENERTGPTPLPPHLKDKEAPVPPPSVIDVLPKIIETNKPDEKGKSVFELNVRRDLLFCFSQPSAAETFGNIVLLNSPTTTTVALDLIVSQGIWKCDFRFNKTQRNKKAVGVIDSTAYIGSDFLPGRGRESLGYYGLNAPVRQGGQWIMGNDEWGDGDVVSVELNMSTTVHTCHFWVNGNQQPVYFTHLPKSLKIIALISGSGATFEVIALKRLASSNLRIMLWETPVQWS